jgi:hypothetical protein
MVPALYEANGTVSLHRGDMDTHRTAMIGKSDALTHNLPADDSQVLLLQIEMGDFFAQRGDWRDAERRYGAAQKGFAQTEQPRLAALAALRAAHMAFTRDNLSLSQQRLDAVAQMPAAEDPAVAQMRAVLAARIAAQRGDQGGIDALLTTLRTNPSAEPVLLEDLPVSPGTEEAAANHAQRFWERDRTQPTSSESSAIQWADIGYMVAPDGHVSEVDVLRGKGNLRWTAPHVKCIAQRRYAPIALPPGQPGVYRVERLTWSAKHIVPSGSLIKRAAGPRTLKVLDLTEVAATPVS